MKHTDQTLTNNFTAGDMADQAASGFREGLSRAIELAKIYGHISLAAHLEHIHDNPDTAYIEGKTDIDEYLNDNEDKADYRIQGIWFKLTCGACPEQYDVFAGPKQVAYVRLRWGGLGSMYRTLVAKQFTSMISMTSSKARLVTNKNVYTI